MRSHKQGAPLLLLGNSLILFLLLAGGFHAFLSAYAIVANRWALLLCCGLFAPAAAALWSVRRGGWAALACLAAAGFAAWRTWDRLGLAALLIRRRVWGGSAGMSGPELTAAGEAMLPLLLLLAAALALWLGWVVVWTRAWYLAAAAVTVPLVPAILAGTLPDWTGLMAGAAGWLALLLTALYDRRDPARLARGTLLSLAGSTALLALLTAALPQEGYERPQWATDARNHVVTAASEGLERLPGWDAAAGSLLLDIGGGTGGSGVHGGSGGSAGVAVAEGRVDLTGAGPRRFSGRTVLTVRTDQSEGSVFLLGGTAAEYTGESWEAETSAPDYSILDTLSPSEDSLRIPPELFPNLTAGDVPAYTMRIRNMAGGGAVFSPYRPAEAVPESAGRDYALAYRPGGPEDGFRPLEGALLLEEDVYRDFVHRQYLSVPARTQEVLLPLLEEVQREAVSIDMDLPQAFQDDVAAARRTAQYLAGLAVYDLDTPAMELGDDFAAHFLSEGRGYCVHFATVGALLLRLQEIPARYASGYVAHLDSDGYAKVLDSDAHAWVEIYLDGYGWYPVEMTPSAPDAGTQDGQPQPSGTDAPEQDRPEQPAPSREEEPAPQPDSAPASSPPEEAPAQEREQVDLTWLWWAALALAVGSSPFAVYRLAVLGRRRARERAETNRSVIAAYGRYRRLLAWGCGEDPALEELARKAAFSQHTLDVQERDAAWERVDALFRQTSGALPGWKRRVLRLLRPLF